MLYKLKMRDKIEQKGMPARKQHITINLVSTVTARYAMSIAVSPAPTISTRFPREAEDEKNCEF